MEIALYPSYSFFWSVSAGLSAQSMAGLGALHGTVTDSTGAVIPKADVVVSNATIGLTREVIASSDGVFEASSLPPADGYQVTVKRVGFSTYVATGIAVHVGRNAVVPVVLNAHALNNSRTGYGVRWIS